MAASVLYLARKTLKSLDDTTPIWVRKTELNVFWSAATNLMILICGAGCDSGALHTLHQGADQSRGQGRAQTARRNA